MATDEYFIQLQDRIGYRFRDVALLKQALTAPGAEGDKDGDIVAREQYDGNRKLAQLGERTLQFIYLLKFLYEEDAEPSAANEILEITTLKENHEKIAKFFGIDTHIKLSPRQRGQASSRTLSLAVCAIFGACFKDSGDISVVRRVVKQFGFGANFDKPTGVIGPMTKSSQEQISVSEVVNEDPLDDGGSSDAFGFLPIPAHGGQGISEIASMETYHELYDKHTSESPEYPTHAAMSNSIRSWDIHTPEQNDTLRLAGYDTESMDDGDFHQILNRKKPRLITSSSVSTSQISLKGYFMDMEARQGNPMSPGSSIFEEFCTSPVHDNHGSVQNGPEEIASSRHSGVGAGEAAFANRASTSASDKIPEKGKRLSSIVTKSSSIDKYILLEKARCESLGLPSPEEGFTSAINLASTKPFRLKEFMTELKVFYFAIASPESLAALKAIVKVQRPSLCGKLAVSNWDLSLAERMKEVESLNESMAHACFIRRCHTHRIFIQSSAGSYKSSDGFITFTSQSILSRSAPQIGNPSNLEDSRVSKLMMAEMYPSLEFDSPEYERKLRFAKTLRKLGQRLDLLVERFGYGILGLLPLALDVPAVEPVLNITDSLILKIPDDMFKWFVQFLDEQQGHILRRASKAISEIVTAIFQGTLDPAKKYGIEQLEQEDILKHPKGSWRILETLSQTPHVAFFALLCARQPHSATPRPLTIILRICSTTTRDTIENSRITLAENIALLSLLSTVPEEPTDNRINEGIRLDNTPRSLTFERERDLADNLAFLSANTDNPEKVTAVCIEEHLDNAGLTVILAANDGDVVRLKAGFERIFTILETVTTQGESEQAKKFLLVEIISLCNDRILSRLRSKHAERSQRNYLKPTLSAGLGKVIGMRSSYTLGAALTPDLRSIQAVCKRFQDLFRDLESQNERTGETVVLLADLIECAHTLTTQLDFDKIVDNLPNCGGFGPEGRASLLTGLRKIGRYSSACEFLLRAARKLSIFKSIKVEAIALPAQREPPNLVGYSPDLVATLKRVDTRVDLSHMCQTLTMKTAISHKAIREKFARTVQATLKSGKLHAEVQIIYHYEMHTAPIRPRVICSSKSACFLCDNFIKHHGRFYVARTHGRLYPKWRLPDLTSMKLSRIRRKEQASVVRNFNNGLQDKIKILLSRRDRLNLSHPNESVFIQPPTWTPSNTSINTRAVSASRNSCARNYSGLANTSQRSTTSRTARSESDITTVEETPKVVREASPQSLLRGIMTRQSLYKAHQDLYFSAGSIHLSVGVAEAGSDNLSACSIEVEWLSEHESARVRQIDGVNIIDAMEIPSAREMMCGKGSETGPNQLYISLGSDIVSIAYFS